MESGAEKVNGWHGLPMWQFKAGVNLTFFEGYYRRDIRTDDQLDDQLCGNLCRCTGYRSIREAATLAFRERHQKNGKDVFSERLKQTASFLGETEYESNGEKFFRPASLDATFQL